MRRCPARSHARRPAGRHLASSVCPAVEIVLFPLPRAAVHRPAPVLARRVLLGQACGASLPGPASAGGQAAHLPLAGSGLPLGGGPGAAAPAGAGGGGVCSVLAASDPRSGRSIQRGLLLGPGPPWRANPGQAAVQADPFIDHADISPFISLLCGDFFPKIHGVVQPPGRVGAGAHACGGARFERPPSCGSRRLLPALCPAPAPDRKCPSASGGVVEAEPVVDRREVPVHLGGDLNIVIVGPGSCPPAPAPS